MEYWLFGIFGAVIGTVIFYYVVAAAVKYGILAAYKIIEADKKV